MHAHDPSAEPDAPAGARRTARTPAHDATSPGVSVVLAVRDEERHLRAAVERVLAQAYDGPFEVVVAVGPSADRTREIADALAAEDPRVRVVDNPTGLTPAGLNIAVAAARHDVVLRVDGHSEIPDGYVRDCVEVLVRTGAANVGGRMHPVGVSPFQRAVARAMSSPLGIGAERFHTGGAAGPASTVYLGCFRRDALERVGGFDERFVRAQDWELNHRLRGAGETVWFEPSLAVVYRPRQSWRALATQFFRTGRWRRQVVATYPETASPRYLAPPVAVVGVVAGTLGAVVGLATGRAPLVLTAAAPLGYAGLVLAGSAVVGRDLPWPVRAWLPVVISTMHLSWGVGFLRGIGSSAPDAAARTPRAEPPDGATPADEAGPTSTPVRAEG